MRVIKKTEHSDIAIVYIGEFINGKYVEFVESVQPPIPQEKKWVLIISTMCGCPVGCSFCDSGSFYDGKLSKEEMFAQIDFPVTAKYSDRKIPVEKFKIQFARMGDPAFNLAVIDVLNEFPSKYDAPGFLPSISTVAPASCKLFFEKLLETKNKLYRKSIQLQFSIHSTNEKQRDEIIPVKKWSFSQISDYASKFYKPGQKKITLNFALAKEYELIPEKLLNYFDPEIFIIKLTPINPTAASVSSGITSTSFLNDELKPLLASLEKAGYEYIKSYGEEEENKIGSNCGQLLRGFMESGIEMQNAYKYKQVELE